MLIHKRDIPHLSSLIQLGLTADGHLLLHQPRGCGCLFSCLAPLPQPSQVSMEWRSVEAVERPRKSKVLIQFAPTGLLFSPISQSLLFSPIRLFQSPLCQVSPTLIPLCWPLQISPNLVSQSFVHLSIPSPWQTALWGRILCKVPQINISPKVLHAFPRTHTHYPVM